MESRLKEIRQHFKLSQGEFGKKIGLSTSAIGEIERGTNRLSNRNVDAICRVFNVNENWLRTGEGEMFNPPKELDFLEKLALERNLTKEDIAIIKSYLDLPPEMRHLVIEFGRNFIKNMSVQLGIEEKIERPPDEKLTADEKRAIMNEELDAEKKAETSSAFTGTSGLKKNRNFS